MKVYIGSSIWRQVEARHNLALVPLLRDERFTYSPIIGDAWIERSRSISATNFLENSDCDIHLSIDSDITDFTLDDTLAMCELAMTDDMVGGMYMTRSPERTFPTSLLFRDKPMVFDPRKHYAEPVKYLATGYVATHRRVFEKLAEGMTKLHEKDGARSYYPFYWPIGTLSEEGDPIGLSEDWAFSKRVTDAGFGVNIDPAIRIGHISTMLYRIEDMFYDPVKPHIVQLTRGEGTKWNLRSVPEPESRQVKRARKRSEAKVPSGALTS